MRFQTAMKTPPGLEGICSTLRKGPVYISSVGDTLWEVGFKGAGLNKLVEGILRQIGIRAAAGVFIYPSLQ